ncbi:TIGR01777 family oxidoreductase [Aquibacillus albus]|uniref:Uncharacterized protein (TIGR01777 family) n=1 Tax=Aquibacillus albus TaxID=1168171 RepID=A0ABS2N2Z3_9BACI|nr:uncharacterized protein (TIGR01777 family) [Aquibacillus albus]
MKVAITGGTGFVGKQLVSKLVSEGHEVYVLTRTPNKYKNDTRIHYVGWLNKQDEPEKELPTIDAFINLAGDSLFGYWTKAKKKRILESRITVTEKVIDLMKRMDKKPSVLINASAIGYYGTSTSASFTEQSKSGNDFLSVVTNQWENKAQEAERLGVRVVLARFGVILGKDGGALPLMALPFHFFAGGKVGSGLQWVSWVHIQDVIGFIQFAMENDKISGPLNVTAPHAVKNHEFSKTLAYVLKKPYWLPAPTFAIRTVLGEMSTLVLQGQAVYPTIAEKYNYPFQYPRLETALRDIFNKSNV